MLLNKGDKVKYKDGSGGVGVIQNDQSNMGYIVEVEWPNGNITACHTNNLEKVEKVETGFLYKEGDRVRLKWNKNAGTIKYDQHQKDHVWVIWDHRAGDQGLAEDPSNLIALHTPRERDTPHPMQAALDNISEEREKLKKQIEDLQFKLGGLTKSYKMLEEGW